MLATKNEKTMKINTDWSGKRVIVIGAARQGVALARFLVQRNARVVLNDRLPMDQLISSQQALQGEDIEWVAGEHPLTLLGGADLVCISGGVPFDLPIVQAARRRGIPISNDSQIFLEECPCDVIGITGSAGKTTTTTLVGLIVQAEIDLIMAGIVDSPASWRSHLHRSIELDSSSKVWVGGNIGIPLLSMINDMRPNDLAVMELSSFQLEVMTRSTKIAAILNITPNHLDRHGTMQAYRSAKSRILRYQSNESIAILNRDDPETWNLRNDVRGELVTFGVQEPLSDQFGVFLNGSREAAVINVPGDESSDRFEILTRTEIPLRGEHNLMNVLAACAVSLAAGISIKAMSSGVNNYMGIPHRLEFVRTWHGADWYNDSIATAPERAIAAIKSFTKPIVLLAGGKDKNLPWDTFASLVNQQVKYVILFGEAAPLIFQALSEQAEQDLTAVIQCAGLKQAVERAAQVVMPGDVVLLSPGGTSFDEFKNFEERGEVFKKWVMELP
jgi:UDP-N-acetylmuramoylalanine--D-glutamate ligase